MKSRKMLSNVLIFLGILVGLLSACVAVTAKDSNPAMLLQPAGARKCAERMLSAIRDGDLEKASSMIYGRPDLGSVPEGSNLAVELIWTDFLNSMDFSIDGDCYVTESGVALDVTLKTLDVPAVIASMEGYAREVLGRRVASAEDLSEIYDDNDNFRREIMDQALLDASIQALTNDKVYREHTLTLKLIFERGKWWVNPDSALRTVLSGSF